MVTASTMSLTLNFPRLAVLLVLYFHEVILRALPLPFVFFATVAFFSPKMIPFSRFLINVSFFSTLQNPLQKEGPPN